MRILITGATGFIGQHLLEDLKKSEISLRILTRQKDPVFWSNPVLEKVNGDISNSEEVNLAMRGVDVLIHMAAELKNMDKFESSNITGVENIAKAAKKAGVKKVIHLSSVGVVGMQHSITPVWIDENALSQPKNGYERSKLGAEVILKAELENSPVSLVILRPTNVFGEKHPKFYLLNLLQYIQSGKPILTKKDSVLNYLYVKDLTQTILHFALESQSEGTFNVGHMQSLRHFMLVCGDILNTKPRLIEVPVLLFNIAEKAKYLGSSKIQAQLQSLSNSVIYSDEKLAKQLNYKYGVEEGLRRTVEYYKDKKFLS